MSESERVHLSVKIMAVFFFLAAKAKFVAVFSSADGNSYFSLPFYFSFFAALLDTQLGSTRV